MAEEGKPGPSRVVRTFSAIGREEEKRGGKEKGRAPDAAQNAVVMLVILAGLADEAQCHWSTSGGVILVRPCSNSAAVTLRALSGPGFCASDGRINGPLRLYFRP
jgi:hypothetical protein